MPRFGNWYGFTDPGSSLTYSESYPTAFENRSPQRAKFRHDMNSHVEYSPLTSQFRSVDLLESTRRGVRILEPKSASLPNYTTSLKENCFCATGADGRQAAVPIMQGFRDPSMTAFQRDFEPFPFVAASKYMTGGASGTYTGGAMFTNAGTPISSGLFTGDTSAFLQWANMVNVTPHRTNVALFLCDCTIVALFLWHRSRPSPHKWRPVFM